MGRTEAGAANRRFAMVQTGKGAIGGLLWLCYVALVGRPDVMEMIALAGLLAPCALAALAVMGVPLEILEAASPACLNELTSTSQTGTTIHGIAKMLRPA